MSRKIKVVNNVHGSLGFNLNPTPESLRVLRTQGAFLDIEEDEIRFIFINQEIIQKGILWIEDKEMRVELGLEKPNGVKQNQNILKHDEISEVIQGNYKRLEKILNEITEPNIVLQFVEIARDLKIDSKAKIDLIEARSKIKIFEDAE